MSGHEQAWLLILAMAFVGGLIVYRLLMGLKRRYVRVLIAALCVTFFVVPAPIPGYENQISPAFVVFIFETFFQIEGQPEASLRILGLSLLLVAVLVGLGHWVFQRYGRQTVVEEGAE